MTNIILRGCNGKMGQVITDIVEADENAVIVAGVDIFQNRVNKYPVYQSFAKCNVKADVIIDFSSPVNMEEMLEFAVKKGIGIVLCTTGLSKEQLVAVEETSKRIPVFQSANMSMGINLISKLLKQATAVLADAGFDIEISAVRGGTIVGEHEIIFAGTDEVIEIKHTAYSKAIFAKGAVQAAKFLPGNPAGIYNMSDVMD